MPQYRSPRPTGTELFMTETLPQITALITDYRKWQQQSKIDSAKQASLEMQRKAQRDQSDRTHQLQLDKFNEAKRKNAFDEKTKVWDSALDAVGELGVDAQLEAINGILDDKVFDSIRGNPEVQNARDTYTNLRGALNTEKADKVSDKAIFDEFVAGSKTYHQALTAVGEDSDFIDDIISEDKRKRSLVTQELNTLKAYAALGSAAFTHPTQPGVLLPRGQKLIQRIGDALDQIVGGAPIDTPQGQKEITLSAGWRNKNPTEVLNELLLQMGKKTIELQEDIVGPDLDMFPLDKEIHVGGEPGEIPPTTYRKMHAETESFSKNPRHPLYSKGGKDASGRPIYEYEYLFKPENDNRLEVDKILGDTRSDSLGNLIDSLSQYGVTTEYGKLDSADIFGSAEDTSVVKTAKEDLKQAILPYSVVSEDVNTITINFNEKDIRMPKKAWVKVKTGEGRINSKRAYKIVAKKLGISVDDVKELMFGHLKKAK